MTQKLTQTNGTPATRKLSKIIFDFESATVTAQCGNDVTQYDAGSPQAFNLISEAWLRSGWDAKYVYSFTWLGRPIIQLPEDIVRIQELFYRVQPDVLLETGIAHGGSAVLFASLCKAINKGRVISIDIEIRPHNLKAIEEHPLFPLITLIEGDAASLETLEKAGSLLKPDDVVMVVLDSCHTKAHVRSELELYSKLVTPGSYIVVMDGIMGKLKGAPRAGDDWDWNNPGEAAREFVAAHDEFVLEEPEFLFNEGSVTERVTYGPSGIIRRIK